MAFLRSHKGKKRKGDRTEPTYYYLVLEDKRCRRVGTNRKEAERIRDDYHARLRRGEMGFPDDATPCAWTLGQLKAAELADASRYGRDLATRGYVWDAVLNVLGPDIRLDRIGKPEFERLAIETLKLHSPATFNRRRALLIHALRLAHGMGIGFDFINPRYPKLPEKKEETRVLTREEADWLFARARAVHPETGRYVELLLETCSRRNEIAAAKIVDGVLVFPPQKRGKRRAFLIVGRLAELLAEGVPRWSRDYWEKAQADFHTQFGFDVWPHMLRHTGLTWAMRKPGMTPEALQKLGGWKSQAMLSTYLHPSDDAMPPVTSV